MNVEMGEWKMEKIDLPTGMGHKFQNTGMIRGGTRRRRWTWGSDHG